MQTLQVDLGERSYPIMIGAQLIDQGELLARHIRGKQVAIVTNDTVAPLYLERLSRSLGEFKLTPIVLPDGEAQKNWQTLQLIFDALLSARHDRNTTIVALGGGVIGDMAGFAGHVSRIRALLYFIQPPYFEDLFLTLNLPSTPSTVLNLMDFPLKTKYGDRQLPSATHPPKPLALTDDLFTMASPSSLGPRKLLKVASDVPLD